MFTPHRSNAAGIFLVLALSLVGFVPSAFSQKPTARLSETWQSGYSGRDANGPHVLGYWQFKPSAVTNDSSAKGNHLTLAGAQAASQGKFDGALESFAGWPVADKRHAALASTKAALSPKGAFTAEMWLKPGAELTDKLAPFLLDKKYVAHTDYQFRFAAADKGGSRHLQAILGFGDASETFTSDGFKLSTNWQHVAFTYDGAGEVRFFLNGAPLGVVRKPGRGPVAPGKVALSIGDRGGSYYGGFPGLIDEVRICDGALEFRPVAVEFRTERKTWLRMERAEPVTVVVRNLSKAAANKLTLRVSTEGLGEKSFDVPSLAAGATHEVAYRFDTSLRPDTYRVKARLEMPGEPPFVSEESVDLVVAPRPTPNQMPVVMWGGGSPANFKRELARMKDIGFTHCLGGGADYGAIWDAKKPTSPHKDEHLDAEKEMLDLALANDFGIAFSLSPGHWLKERKELQRVDRNGKPNAARPDVNAALPGLTDFCFNVGASIAQAYDKFPAWQAALINTETRDSAQVSFSQFDRDAYRKFSGEDIPAEVAIKNGVEWGKLKNFSKDRVVPDDHPLLKFYRWYWTTGDGWNGLNTAVHRGLHSTGRRDMWTWFDPAIRAPSIGGSGGEVDVLGQWTYTYPDPLRIGYFTDELLAMAANSPQKPRVMKMTQLIMYRSQTAPKKSGTSHIASPFDDHDPDAAYITTAPMHVREAFWTEIARPIAGIMYHGWQSLVPTDSIGGYRYTNPDTQSVLRELLHGVVKPLGPTLCQIGERRTDVAYLDSFTAQMFARRGSYGYSSDETYLTLLYAQLQPEVLFEETLMKQGLDPYHVLVLSDCDVLPAGVVKRVQEFQKRGGVVIGDDNLAPAIKADIVVPKVTRTKKGDVDKATLLANATKLRAALDAKYARPIDSTNPEISTHLRGSGESDYVFVVNDRREFGTYIGQHGLVMENGLPSAGEISLTRKSGHVYDLRASREVPVTAREGKLRWPVNLGPCDGGIFLATSNAIHSVVINAGATACTCDPFKITVNINDADGAAIPAVVPVRVDIVDPAGRAGEFSGFYGARDGKLDLQLDFAKNDPAGVWEIRVRELASGITAKHFARLPRE